MIGSRAQAGRYKVKGRDGTWPFKVGRRPCKLLNVETE